MRKLLWRLAVLAPVALLVALGSFAALHWEPDRSVDELAGRWAKPPSEFLAVGGMQVHLRDEGPRSTGPVIVLLHGTSSSLHTWNGWAARLRDEFRVVRFDLPGFGLTGPHPGDDYSTSAYVDFVVSMLDELAIDDVVLVGNSLGGRIAWRTALEEPQRVRALVLVDASGYATKPQSVPLGFRIARMPGMRHLMRRVLPRSVIESSARNVFGDPSRVTPELVDRYFELTTRAGNRDALTKRMQNLAPGAMSERISDVSQPTLILWGGRDRLIPVSAGERFARDISGSELVVWDDLGHVPQEEDPARTVAALEDFIERLGTSGPVTSSEEKNADRPSP